MKKKADTKVKYRAAMQGVMHKGMRRGIWVRGQGRRKMPRALQIVGGGGEVLGGGGGQRGLQRWLQRETCRGVARRIQMGAVCSASLRNRQHPPRHPNGNSSDSFSCQGHCLPLNIRCGNPDNSCGLETNNNAYFGCFVHAY